MDLSNVKISGLAFHLNSLHLLTVIQDVFPTVRLDGLKGKYSIKYAVRSSDLESVVSFLR